MTEKEFLKLNLCDDDLIYIEYYHNDVKNNRGWRIHDKANKTLRGLYKFYTYDTLFNAICADNIEKNDPLLKLQKTRKYLFGETCDCEAIAFPLSSIKHIEEIFCMEDNDHLPNDIKLLVDEIVLAEALEETFG